MEDRQLPLETDLQDRDASDWLREVRGVFEAQGFFQTLGERHSAGFVEAGNKLLITFENIERARNQNIDAEPRGFTYTRNDGWSHLAIFSEGESWFRDPAIFAFFDRMIDDGFFEDFEDVLFFGGDGGTAYAAAAYSVAAPAAKVLALRPQATLEGRRTGWDDRYRHARKGDFASRYGYAPDMVEGAEKVFIAYDASQHLDACHAAMFQGAHVTLLPAPLIGEDLEAAFDRMGVLDVMLRLAMDKSLDRKRFNQLLRARRYDQTYLRNLVDHLLENGHAGLAKILCRYMLTRETSTYFRRKLETLQDREAG